MYGKLEVEFIFTDSVREGGVMVHHFQQYFSYIVALNIMLYQKHFSMSGIQTRNFSGDRH